MSRASRSRSPRRGPQLDGPRQLAPAGADQLHAVADDQPDHDQQHDVVDGLRGQRRRSSRMSTTVITAAAISPPPAPAAHRPGQHRRRRPDRGQRLRAGRDPGRVVDERVASTAAEASARSDQRGRQRAGGRAQEEERRPRRQHAEHDPAGPRPAYSSQAITWRTAA